MRIAVIPARGGSKRIPRKNIKAFCGRPIIAWSIEAAQHSRCFDRIFVSTDDKEIAEISRRYGAETPFVRDPKLSDDHTGTIPVIADAIDWMNRHESQIDFACCIYPTAPLIRSEDLRIGYESLKEKNVKFAFSVASYKFPIQRAIRITADQRVQMYHPEHFNTRSQDLEEAFHDAGQFYWGRADAWLAGTPLFGPDSIAIRVPRHRAQDIDTLEDWDQAELMFKVLMNSQERKYDI